MIRFARPAVHAVPRRTIRDPATLGWATLLSGAAVTGVLVGSASGLRIALAIGAGFFLVVFALRAPRSVLVSLVVWFVMLGLVRRLTSSVSPKEAWGDPLLLVGTGTWVALAIVAVRQGALTNRGRLTSAVLILAGLLGLSALNPLQGGLATGLSGAMVVVVPMAAFLIGRSLVDDALFRRLLGVVAWLGLAVAVYGLYQTFVALPPWDERWVADHGYSALNVGGVIRAFASFSAGSEYASFLAIAIVVWVAAARDLVRLSLGVAAVGLLGAALWYESSRGIIVLTVGAIGMMLAAKARLTFGRSLLFGGAVLLALPAVIGHIAPAQFSDAAGDRLAEHQVEGLTDPFGKSSSLPDHIDRVVDGITGAAREPLGVGVGAVTIAGDKYGGTARPTEADPGNVAVAAGLPGLLGYLAVLVLGMLRLYRRAVRRRDPLSLAALGIVLATSFQWLNGGHYATAFWPWLVLGWSEARCDPKDVEDVAFDALSPEVPVTSSPQRATA